MDWHAIMNHLMDIVQHTGGDQLLSDFYYKNFIAGLCSVFLAHTFRLTMCTKLRYKLLAIHAWDTLIYRTSCHSVVSSVLTLSW
jgi:hypothetical protein